MSYKVIHQTPRSRLPRLQSFMTGVQKFHDYYAAGSAKVFIKSSLPHVNNSSIQLAYWTNLGSAVMVAPFVVLNGELTALSDLIAGAGVGKEDLKVFIAGSAVTGLFGFFICVAALISIKVTSPVTHMFSSVSSK